MPDGDAGKSVGVLPVSAMPTLAASSAAGAAPPPDDSAIDYRALYFQEAEKNKQLLQWIVQLQSNLSMRLQMIEPRLPTGAAAPDEAHAAPGPTKLEQPYALASSPSSCSSAEASKGAHTDAGKTHSEERPAGAGAREAVTVQQAAPRAGHEQKAVESADGARSSPEYHSQQGKTEQASSRGSQERTSPGADAPSAQQGREPEVNGGDLSRLVSKAGNSSNSNSQTQSPSLSHRGSNAQGGAGQENPTAPEMAHIDLARTTCSKCGQGFAFCAAFLSRHDFLVMPCPKCRAAAAIPPTPLAPTPNASATRPAHWPDNAISNHQMGVVGVSRDGFL